MVTVPVSLVSFRAASEPVPVRFVLVPDGEFMEVQKDRFGSPLSKPESEKRLLELVYRYGQNHVQPRDQRSVSVGDVICLSDRFYLVLNIGFRLLGQREFEFYVTLDRDQRERCYHV